MGEQHLQVSHLGLELVSGGVPAAGVVVGAALHRADLVEGGGLVQRGRHSAVGVLRHLRGVQQPSGQTLLPWAFCNQIRLFMTLAWEGSHAYRPSHRRMPADKSLWRRVPHM